ncbi:MAG: VCBS domain-containing protein, partial [Rubrivivax sp.]
MPSPFIKTTGSVLSRTLKEADSPSPLTATGVILFDDLDTADTHVVSAVIASSGNLLGGAVSALVSTPATGAAQGRLTWTYAVDPARLQELAAGQRVTETFTITLRDNTGATVSQVISVVVTGTNDAPVILSAGEVAGSVAEAARTVASLSTTGSFQFDDTDLTDKHTVAVTKLSGAYGGTLRATITDTATGAGDGTVRWTYSLSNTATQSLGAGETATETFSVRISDGKGGLVSQTVTLTITGTNDVPVILSAVDTAAVREDVGVSPAGQLLASGVITFDDVDLTDTHGVTVEPVSSSAPWGLAGSLTTVLVTAAGSAIGSLTWTYALDNTAAQQLGAGEVAQQVFTLRIADMQNGVATGDSVTRTITVQVTGSNDAPLVIVGVQDTAGLALEENLSGLTGQGSLTVVDPDLSDTVTVAVTGVAIAGNNAPGLTEAQALAMFSIADAADGDLQLLADPGAAGNLRWLFNSGSTGFSELGRGETLTLTYTLQVTEARPAGTAGLMAQQTVTVTITGTGGAPIVSGDIAGAVLEAGHADDGTSLPGEPQATGVLTVSNLGDGQAPMWSLLGGGAGQVGQFQIDASTGTWTYTLDNAAANSLAEGQTLTETFTVTVADTLGASTTQQVQITVTGGNDGPVVTNDSTAASGAVVEAGQATDGSALPGTPTASGTLTAT